jgi:DNA-nicking Smr family endonuclease
VNVGSRKKPPPGPFEGLRALREELARKENEPAAKPAPPPPTPKAEPETPADEELLLHRLFAGVTPLDRKKEPVARQRVERSRAVEQRANAAADAAEREAEQVRERLRSLVDGQARFEVADDGTRVEGRRVDLPADAVRALRRGLLPIDARLDLHGLSAREAQAKLEVFLRTTRARGERCVLVIHGKGTHSPGGVSVLRGEIAAWLSQGASSAEVAAFVTAREADGGEGAIYVLLRR